MTTLPQPEPDAPAPPPSAQAIRSQVWWKGEAIDATGKNILDPAHPAWGGKPPVIAWPE